MDPISKKEIPSHQPPRELVDIFALDCTYLDVLQPLSQQAYQDQPHPTRTWTEKDFAYFLSHETGYAIGIQTKKNELCAFLLGLCQNNTLDIATIATHPDHRRKGYARALLLVAHAEAGCAQITLEVSTKNRSALALYHSVGLSVVGRRPQYYADQGDAYLMST